MCGGTSRLADRAGQYIGLSPRVRGNPCRHCPFDGKQGSIPACAGEPGLYVHPRLALRVYPRVCGGTPVVIAVELVAEGLSPRVRGNPPSTDRRISDVRSIPACAGEPVATWVRITICQVYPRVCGGTPWVNHITVKLPGLSPRVRGNHRPRLRYRHAFGSIPACAGEPYALHNQYGRQWVYPRVCGGTPAHGHHGRRLWGLSPRVRGNRLDLELPPNIWRSIPACAGEPVSLMLAKRGDSVYPRVCGGTDFSLSLYRYVTGLSPRVRGNHPH